MKKAIGQTVRDLKRGVNKKVLKVPGIEQKVLDSTSNEPWGPHGSLLADIAQASRNPHEYQMIMAVIWKRINDTGKNWRHVYKALILLEYLVSHGSERVIDEIREHAYQISTLADFQYIDSSGKDQGNNVRKKSQSLVFLVNDKDRITEARQKAAVNRDKFRNNSGSGMYRPGSYDRNDDDRYGYREEDRNGYGYGREREGGYRDDDRNSRDGDRYGRDYEERYGKDSYRDDDYRGSDRDRDRDDDGQYSSRGSYAKAEDNSLEARLERKLTEQNVGAPPPSYEEAIGEARSPMHSEREVETSVATAPRGPSPHANDIPSQSSVPTAPSPSASNYPTEATASASMASSGKQKIEATDDFFDPRGSVDSSGHAATPGHAAPQGHAATQGHAAASSALVSSNNVEMDYLGSLSDPFSMALVPTTPDSAAPEGNANTASTSSFAAQSHGSSNFNQQSFEDPFGDSPFKATPSTETAPSHPQMYHSPEHTQSSGFNAESMSSYGFADSFSVVPYSTSAPSNTQNFSTNSQFSSHDVSSSQQEIDILADILPPAAIPQMNSHHNFSAPGIAQSSPSFSASSSQMAPHPFSEPTGPFTHQDFSVATSLPFSAPTSQPGQVQSPFSAPNGQPGQVQSPFSAPNGQPGQYQSPFSASNGQPGQVQSPFSAPNGQPGQVQSPFSAPNGQPEQVQSTFSASDGQPGQAQSPFSAPTSQYGQQPFSSHSSQPGFNTFSSSTGQSMQSPFASQGSQPAQSSGYMYGGFTQDRSLTQGAPNTSLQSQNGYNGAVNSGNFLPQVSTAVVPPHMAPQAPTGQLSQSTNFTNYGGSSPHTPADQASQFSNQSFIGQQGNAAPFSSPMSHQPLIPSTSQYTVSTGSNSMVVSQPAKEKFETKSTVWADTLSRGLVNLNISGPKTNPLADIGVDFESINRKEKRMEKPTPQTVTSTITMGKAMGAGSGIGRAGAGALRPAQNSIVGSGMGMGMGNGPGAGMGMGMGVGPGAGVGMGGYGGMNPPMGGYGGMNPSMGGYGGMNPSMGGYGGMNSSMGMGMGQGSQMQPPPGSNMPGSYNNPMMGPGSYGQQPYGGYR